MIANTLIFLLGMLLTTLAALILAPLFWRKAQSLARREFEATVPISANEIRAEFDRVRAEAAVSVRRQEVLSAEMREKAAVAEADRGLITVEAAVLQKESRRLMQTLEEQDVELEATRATLAKREEENRRLAAELAELREESEATALEFDALGKRFRDLGAIAEEQAIELATARAKAERLEATAAAAAAVAMPRAGEEAHRAGSPRFEKASGRRELAPLAPAEQAEIRERISEVAARVIRMTALAEGPASPLAGLLQPDPSDKPSAGGAPSLAERVRLLADAERKAGSAGAPGRT